MKQTTPVMMFVSGALACVSLWLPSAHAAAPAGGTLKVCADPDYLPYSNRDGKGFENDIASYVADKLGAKLDYVWGNTRRHGGFSEYLARNLDNGRCDVVIDMPYGNQEELTTDPYYTSSYVFVFKKNKGHDLQSLDSPELHRLKVGFESETPIETGLQLRGMVMKAKSFDVGGKSGTSPRSVLEAVENGTIDVMITWQPSIGAFLKEYPDLTTVTVPNSRVTGYFSVSESAPHSFDRPQALFMRLHKVERV